MFFHQPYISVQLTKDQTVPTPKTNIDCSELNKMGCEEVLENPALNRPLFPSGMVVIGREPFIIHPINFDAMSKEASTIQASFSPQSSEITCMSFGTGVLGDNKVFIYDLAIYSSSGDASELAQHIYTHIPIAQSLSGESRIAFNVFGQVTKDGDCLIRAFRDVDEMNPSGQHFVNEDTKISTHVLMSVPLESYLKTCKLSYDKKL